MDFLELLSTGPLGYTRLGVSWGALGHMEDLLGDSEGPKGRLYIYIYILYIYTTLDVQMGAKAPIFTRSLRSLLKARISDLKLRTSELKPRISELKSS